MRTFKKTTACFLAALLTLLSAVFAVPASAAPAQDIQLTVKAESLSLQDSVCMTVRVEAPQVPSEEMKLLVWRDPQTAYTADNAAAVLACSGKDTAGLHAFIYRDLYAKNMTDTVYYRAYANHNGQEIYGKLGSFSVVEYAYKLNKMSGQEKTKKLVRAMLEYGAAAQECFDYRLDFLANSPVTEIRVQNGTLAGGLDKAYVQTGADVVLTANVHPEGKAFLHFADDSGRIVGKTSPCTVAAIRDNVYTAIYEGDAPVPVKHGYQAAQLTGNKAVLYERIKTAVDNRDRQVDVSDLNLQMDDIQNVQMRYMVDYPQSFFLDRSMHAATSNGKPVQVVLYYTDGVTRDVYDSTGHLVKQPDMNLIDSKIAALDRQVNTILKSIPADLTNLEKEKFLHDYIQKTVVYDKAAAESAPVENAAMPHAYDMYGAACEQKAVCEGYSKLFSYLCRQVGIEATCVRGSSKGVGHMWNAVEIDGQWYHVDVTWDDGVEGNLPHYAYFNVTEEQIKQDHMIDTVTYSVPSCTAEDAVFYKHFGVDASDLSKEPLNLRRAADSLARGLDDYLLVHYQPGAQPGNEYMAKYLVYDSSVMGQYIKEKGYTFSISPSMSIVGDYLYLKVVRA